MEHEAGWDCLIELLLNGEYLEDGEGFGDIVEINTGKFINLRQ
jgi:hypothetical protein